MNKFLVMIILKPDIRDKRINNIQNCILNLFEQNTNVKKVWYLGRQKLDYKSKRYNEGIFLKLDITAKPKKIEQIREILRKNPDILSSVIMNNDNEKNKLPSLKLRKLQFNKKIPIYNTSICNQDKKIYILISKNIKLPFSQSDIVAISEDEGKILQYANKKIQEYLFIKGYRTLKPFKIVNDVEKELRTAKRVQFTLGNNSSVGQELLIQEKYLI